MWQTVSGPSPYRNCYPTCFIHALSLCLFCHAVLRKNRLSLDSELAVLRLQLNATAGSCCDASWSHHDCRHAGQNTAGGDQAHVPRFPSHDHEVAWRRRDGECLDRGLRHQPHPPARTELIWMYHLHAAPSWGPLMSSLPILPKFWAFQVAPHSTVS